ncbi:predicted protein [Nematostella vectensis]|uniref:long-chain-fatty-acid--CoA ligase n=1 Tax=Nematostella vectensis TaxID=45351 RepID=A7RYU2_NEMVE|nr:predicted protein [Nematostella vectensis]|eukprot:XP_001635484.1 predicted protein [Nematostella vectensis]
MKKTSVWLCICVAIAWLIYALQISWLFFPAIFMAVFLCSGGRNFPRVFFKTILRDLKAIIAFTIVQLKCRYYNYKNVIMADLFESTAASLPNKPAFVFEGKSWTFKEADEFANRIANYFKSQGYAKGDVIALILENRPEFILIWLGLSKIGVISALINTNLHQDSLLHCISAANSKAIIFGSNFADSVVEIQDKLPENMLFYCHGNNGNSAIPAVSLDQTLRDSSPKKAVHSHQKSHLDVLMYIYTSGTTGLPKAALIRNSRYFMATGLYPLLGGTTKDVVYCPLPLYHSAAGILAVGYCIVHGSTLVLRKKFSASRFWDECIEHNVTVVQYIGELCRYLLAQPPRPTDNQHSVRLAIGNGLRPKIWTEFQSRFNITKIGEFYASTEGNANVINIDNQVGAVGFTSRIVPSAYPVKVVRVDPETGELIRGPDGLAVDCQPGEAGEMVSRIIKSSAVMRFDGYLNQRETSKKIARSVFSKDDYAFLSGDIVVQDEYGYVYFRDRTGDTFRWLGENVSTAEVESIASKFVGLRDVVVYGVEVPGAEGKAGMMAIVDTENSLELDDLACQFKTALPSYARPRFVRVMKAVDLTGTFKFQKFKLKKEGFDIGHVKDPLYYLDIKTGSYLPLDSKKYQLILDEKLRL